MKHLLAYAVVFVSLLTVYLNTAGGGTVGAYPPDGIYTCAWIAANPTAATLARVSCRADGVNPGSQITPAEAADLATPSTPDTNPCQRVPGSGAIGTNVYAATTFEYSTAWFWPTSSRGEPFWWYIKHTDGSNQAYNYSAGGGGQLGVPANIYQWKVQNKGADAQYWDGVCYSS